MEQLWVENLDTIWFVFLHSSRLAVISFPSLALRTTNCLDLLRGAGGLTQ